MSALGAAFALDGARQTRARELAGMLTDCQEHCERLQVVVVEGDARANNPDRLS